MRLGVVLGERRGMVDRVLAEAAGQLATRGLTLAGVVQENPEVPGRRCDMDLVLLEGGTRVRISQCLGPLARGCRLDPTGLEAAVGQVAARLEDAERPALVIVNKFGKAEIGGRGFRPVIGRALELGLPVLVGLNRANLDGFEHFAQGLAEALPAEVPAVVEWALGAVSIESVYQSTDL
jgi:nucleoside-triphosphatase THEP1